MELQYKIGDLLRAAHAGEVQVIAHGCNCFNTMGSGIAPQIAKAYPSAYDADQATRKGSAYKLGCYSYGTENGLHIFNLYTQFGYWGRNEGKRDLNYPALELALFKMAHALKNALYPNGSHEHIVVGLPKIGAGLAGGDWNIISGLIKQHLVDEGIKVVIYMLEGEKNVQQTIRQD